jgi:hypothetical protein
MYTYRTSENPALPLTVGGKAAAQSLSLATSPSLCNEQSPIILAVSTKAAYPCEVGCICAVFVNVIGNE